MRALAAAFCFSLISCSSHEYKLHPLSHVTRVDIARNDTRVLRSISHPATITQLKEFVAERSDGWRAPFPDTPVPRLHAYFYDGSELVGNIGVGLGFFETQYSLGLWLSRSASRDDERHFLQIIGMAHFDLRK
jgi:hypothetical protein